MIFIVQLRSTAQMMGSILRRKGRAEIEDGQECQPELTALSSNLVACIPSSSVGLILSRSAANSG